MYEKAWGPEHTLTLYVPQYAQLRPRAGFQRGDCSAASGYVSDATGSGKGVPGSRQPWGKYQGNFGKEEEEERDRKLIELGHDVSVRWVPGHSGVEGNKRADKAAKEAFIGERVRIAKWQKGKGYRSEFGMSKRPRNERLAGRGFYIPCLKTQIHSLLGKTKKLYASRVIN